MRKNLLSPFFKRSCFLAVLLILIALPHSLGAQSAKPAEAQKDPLKTLMDDNKHFVDDAHFILERARAYRVYVQHPYAIILSCSDSRVPPELVFGEWGSLGSLFVIRSAGNVIDPVALGSIEYGAQKLHAKLILVLGHENCGAVRAARAQAESPQTPNIAWFVDPIKLAVERTRNRSEIETVKENVSVQIQNLRNQSSIIRELEKEGLQIVGGLYNLTGGKSGVVELL